MNPKTRLDSAGGLLIELCLLAGVYFGGWRIDEVLLLYWFELAFTLILLPVSLGVRRGTEGVVERAAAVIGLGLFTAFHSFFLVCLLYGVNWSQAQGGPGGWSAPTTGKPGDWYAAALAGLPMLGVAWVVSVRLTDVVAAWRFRRMTKAVAAPDTPQPAPTRNLMSEVVVMHLTIIFGGSVVLAAGGAIGLVLTLVGLRTGHRTLQFVQSLRAHGRPSARQSAARRSRD
ncbi:MAG: DUF6498-containing protein [Planctomycetota bacterium]